MNDSEQALLSIIAQDPEWTRKNASQLSPVLFDKEQHRLIFEAITECGSEWDMVKIVNVLRTTKRLEKVGGAGCVSDFFVDFWPPSMAQYHLGNVRQSATLRRTLKAHQEAQAKIEEAITHGTTDAAALVAAIREELDSAGRLPGKRLDRMTSAEVMEVVVNHIEERAKNPGAIAGITSGFEMIDKLTHGLQEGHLWVIAGGPGDGKSTLMQNILEGAVAAGIKSAIYQLEMPVEEQGLRLLASDSSIDSGNLLAGKMTQEEALALAASVKRLKKAGTDYVNTDSATADDILADLEQGDYRVVMVDYLQLLEIDQAKGENREQAISTVARKLKNVAKRKKMTILTGSQLNDDGKLRESRAIGQHADKVCFVQKVTNEDGEIDETRRIALFEKNRGGPPRCKVPLRFAGAYYRFTQEDRELEEADWTEKMPTRRRKR